MQVQHVTSTLRCCGNADANPTQIFSKTFIFNGKVASPIASGARKGTITCSIPEWCGKTLNERGSKQKLKQTHVIEDWHIFQFQTHAMPIA